MGRFNKYSDGVGAERKAEKKDLLGADLASAGRDPLWSAPNRSQLSKR